MNIGIRADVLTTSDFEDFSIEIVKKMFNKPSLHGFTEGRDNGIDAIDDIKNPTIIVQAKRWKITKDRKSAVRLLKDEIDKIELNIIKYGWETKFKYVIITSLDLTPKNIKEIREYAEIKLPGAIPNDDYIIFASVLNTLSQDDNYISIFEHYGLIEKNLSKILNDERLRNIEWESRDYIEGIDFEYFVETDILRKAYNILQEHHILLIQGPAGIGKSTTCSVLGRILLNNQENDFNVIVRKIEDIDVVLADYNNIYRESENRKLFIIFDDFLGRNSFDVSQRALLNLKKLYSTVIYSNNLFVCLNSRAQILNTAITRNYDFEQLVEEKLQKDKIYSINLLDYNEIEKSLIFRKTFEKKISSIQGEERIELSGKYNSLIGKNWRSIINHSNYFPRLIEFIVKNFKSSGSNFYKYILDSLSNPSKLYDNLFENLDRGDKYLLFSILMFNEYPVVEQDIINSVSSLNLDSTYDVNKSLTKLDGSWIRFVTDSIGCNIKVNFYNPSIVDYLNHKRVKLKGIEREIIEKSRYLRQLCPSKNKFRLIPNENGILTFETAEVNDYYNKNEFLSIIYNNWGEYTDKSDFIGERIISIVNFAQDISDEIKNELSTLLKQYNGRNNLGYTNGWDNVINSIYFSSNDKLRSYFLTVLNCEFDVITNILTSSKIDLEDIDSIANKINELIYDEYLFGEGEVKNLTETSYYSQFLFKKKELVQQFINDDTILDEELDFTIDFNKIDENEYVQIGKNHYIQRVNEHINVNFKWEDLDFNHFDYSVLEMNLRRNYVSNYDNYLDFSEDHDEDQKILYTNNKIQSETETIEKILNVELY